MHTVRLEICDITDTQPEKNNESTLGLITFRLEGLKDYETFRREDIYGDDGR